jgi:hypothetical protein
MLERSSVRTNAGFFGSNRSEVLHGAPPKSTLLRPIRIVMGALHPGINDTTRGAGEP